MARNGSGKYSRVSGVPYVYNTVIDQVVVNAEMDDIATALTASLAKDGQTTPTANLPMGTFRHTGVGAAVARTDYARAAEVQDGAITKITSVAGTNTITASAPISMAAYAVGQEFTFIPAATNTGAATLNINSIGAGAVQQGGKALVGSELKISVPVRVLVTAATPVFEIVGSGALFGPHVRADIASATTLDLDATLTHSLNVTGTTPTTGMTLADGSYRILRANAAWPITHGASLICPGSASYTCAAGDLILAIGEPAGVVRLVIWKANGTAVVSSSAGVQIQPISASVGSNAMTISASALSLDFRSATLTSGAVTTVSGTPANLVISSGSTLGTVNAVQSRIAVLALNNAGTIELAAVNLAGGNDLSETGVISTTAEGGAGAADTANVIYSTTARSNLAYRVIGYIESTQATAGTWATAPSTIQGAGGNAITAMSSLGYGQTWKNVTGSRSAATTYYNTTGRPISVSVTNTSGAGNSTALTVNGVVVANAYISAAAASQVSAVAIVPPGGSYSVVITGTIGVWAELR